MAEVLEMGLLSWGIREGPKHTPGGLRRGRQKELFPREEKVARRRSGESLETLPLLPLKVAGRAVGHEWNGREWNGREPKGQADRLSPGAPPAPGF